VRVEKGKIESELTSVNQRLEDAKSKIADLDKDNQSLAKDKSELQVSLASSTAKLESKETQFSDLKQEITLVRSESSDANKSLATARAELKANSEALGQVIAERDELKSQLESGIADYVASLPSSK
jgi:chromosome segregation ATPase